MFVERRMCRLWAIACRTDRFKKRIGIPFEKHDKNSLARRGWISCPEGVCRSGSRLFAAKKAVEICWNWIRFARQADAAEGLERGMLTRGI